MKSATTIQTTARVIVAERDEVSRLVLCENLETDRFTACPVGDVDELVGAASDGADVIILDQYYDLSLDALRRVLAESAVIVVGPGGQGDIARALAAGAED